MRPNWDSASNSGPVFGTAKPMRSASSSTATPVPCTACLPHDRGLVSVAEDIVSLTFLEAWRLRERIGVDGGPLRPWLLGIATNVGYRNRRTARRRAVALARLPRGGAVPDFAERVAGRIDDAAQLRLVTTALSRLDAPSGKSWRCAGGTASTTRPLPRPWACPWELCVPGCPGPV